MSLLCNGKLSSRRFNKSLSDIISNIWEINDENQEVIEEQATND